MAPDAGLHPGQFAFAFRPSERLDGAASPLRPHPRFSRNKSLAFRAEIGIMGGVNGTKGISGWPHQALPRTSA